MACAVRDRDPDSRYAVTAAGFTFCQDCGALIMEGYRPDHDELHDRLVSFNAKKPAPAE